MSLRPAPVPRRSALAASSARQQEAAVMVGASPRIRSLTSATFRTSFPVGREAVSTATAQSGGSALRNSSARLRAASSQLASPTV